LYAVSDAAWAKAHALVQSRHGGVKVKGVQVKVSRRKQRRGRTKCKEQQQVAVREPTGLAARSHSVQGSVDSIDGISSDTTQGPATSSRPSTSSANASTGVPDPGAASSERLFKLHQRLPDAHLPYEFRLERSQWRAFELYDAWRRGAILHDGDTQEYQEAEYDEAAEDGEVLERQIVDDVEFPCGDASLVTMMLVQLCPDPSRGRLDDGSCCIDARRPMADQLDKFPSLGWGSSPPTTLELVQRRVTRSETSFEFDKLNNPGMRYAYTCGAFLANQQDPRADATDADGYDDEPWGSDSDLDADTSDVHRHGAA
jgi:hypothetical protein